MYQMRLEACNFYHVFSGNEEKLWIQFDHQSHQLNQSCSEEVHSGWWTHGQAGRAAHLQEAGCMGALDLLHSCPTHLSHLALPMFYLS